MTAESAAVTPSSSSSWDALNIVHSLDSMKSQPPANHLLVATNTATEQPTDRLTATFEENPKFVTQQRDYARQYAGLYWYRLEVLKKNLQARALERWGAQAKYVEKLLDVEAGEQCFIIGTVYLEMALKPNVLDEVSLENNIVAGPTTATKYASPHGDTVTVEDQSGRIELVGDCLQDEILVTGMVVAVLGCEGASGAFEIQDLCYPGLPPQNPLPSLPEPKLVAFLSGFNLGDDASVAGNLDLEMLVDFLTGQLGSVQDELLSGKIARVVFCGNGLARMPELLATPTGATQKKNGADLLNYDFSSLQLWDQILARISATVPVDVLPGPHDPTSFVLPQKPIHKGMFQNASQSPGFTCRTNPFLFRLDGVEILGTSGQNIDDLCRYVLKSDDPMDLACASLSWRHIAPTAPDTLQFYPYQDCDPFILQKLPHVYVFGNQETYESRRVEEDDKQVQVISVPSYSKTKTIVLMDLQSQESFPLCLDFLA